MFGCWEFRRLKNSRKVSLVFGHIRNISSMKRIQRLGMGVPFSIMEPRNSSSRLAMNKLAKVGAHLVPMATPCFCL